MRPLLVLILLVIVVGAIGGWLLLRPVQVVPVTGMEDVIARLEPLHERLGPPQPGDWLTDHPEEGQTFAQYLLCDPKLPTTQRRKIYVQPLGDFTTSQRQIVDKTADFLGRYFALPVVVQPDLPMDVIPENARRVHPSWGVKQILSTYVLHELMAPRLPADAAAAIALTATDLWPGRGWNFVFGQASLRQRVGVWSMNRNGDPDASDAAFRLCLLRTLKTATHETGHMFSVLHCTAYECNMCGSNHREESDRRPVALCPECVAKICWGCDVDPVARFDSLVEFCETEGLADEADFYRRSRAALQ
ncbi:MAG: archaemetzincin [Planctomycetota bacterium]